MTPQQEGQRQLTNEAPPNTAAAVVEKPLMGLLGKYKGQIEQILPKQFNAQRVLKLIIGAINKDPKLLQCTPMSVINAVLTAATIGVEIRPNSAYLIPFAKNFKDDAGRWRKRFECTLIIDYRGKIDLAVRSGRVTDIDAEIVYSKDKFRVYRDPESGQKRIEHEPIYYKVGPEGQHLPIEEADRGVAIGALVVAAMKEAKPKVLFMPRIDILAIKNRSKAKEDGPWVTDELEMWKKTAIHRMCKTLPQSPEGELAQRLDDANELGITMDVIDIDPADDSDAPLLPQSSVAQQEVAEKKIREMEAKQAARQDKPEDSQTSQSPDPSPQPAGAGPATDTESEREKYERGMLPDANSEEIGVECEYEGKVLRVILGEDNIPVWRTVEEPAVEAPRQTRSMPKFGRQK